MRSGWKEGGGRGEKGGKRDEGRGEESDEMAEMRNGSGEII